MKRSIALIMTLTSLFFSCQSSGPFPGGSWKIAEVILPEAVDGIKEPVAVVKLLFKQTTLQLNKNHSAVVLIPFGPLISKEPRKDVQWSYDEETKVLTLKNAFQNWQVQEFTVVTKGNEIYFNPGYFPVNLKMKRD